MLKLLAATRHRHRHRPGQRQRGAFKGLFVEVGAHFVVVAGGCGVNVCKAEVVVVIAPLPVPLFVPVYHWDVA